MLMQCCLLNPYNLTVVLEACGSKLYSLKCISTKEQALCPCGIPAQEQYVARVLSIFSLNTAQQFLF